MDQLAVLNSKYKNKFGKRDILVGSALPAEQDEQACLPRVFVTFNKVIFSQLRAFIDDLNSLVSETYSSPKEACAPEIPPVTFSPDYINIESEV